MVRFTYSYHLIGFIILFFGLFSCIQFEQEPDKLRLGYYSFIDREGIRLLNDLIAVMYLNFNGEEIIDTLKYKYQPPLFNENIITSGDIFFLSKINQNSELYKYRVKMKCDGKLPRFSDSLKILNLN